MAPRVIKLERANEVGNEGGASDGPSQPSPSIEIRLSKRSREHDTSDRVGKDRHPNRAAC